MSTPRHSSRWALAAVAAALVGGTAMAQVGQDPHIGYVYPAGGKQGTLLHIIAGGQQLRMATEVRVTGNGVRATIIRFVPMTRKVEREQLPEVRKCLLALRQDPHADSSHMEPTRKIAAKSPPKPPPAPPTPPTPQKAKTETPAAPAAGGAAKGSAQPAAKPPVKPEEVAVDTLSLRELECYWSALRTFDKRQQNTQLAEGVLIEVEIEPDAAPGERELRLIGPNGVSNPMHFQVGVLPEAYEQEPMNRETIEPPVMLNTPCTINGQVMPGDRDTFRFHARRGERVVVDVSARRLVPFLADAVPGWFEPVIAVYDESGRELAFADDSRESPDPALMYQIPTEGEYRLEIHDALYRGREDFVYRIDVGELPHITSVFPLGGPAGVATTASISGWNLAGRQAPLDTSEGVLGVRTMHVMRGKWLSNEVPYAVGELPESVEPAPGNEAKSQDPVDLPRIINGRIGRPGEVDVFRIEGRAGQELVAEVQACRLHSRLDSRITITDESGAVLAANDDTDQPTTGLMTNNSDSYARVTLPAAGLYFVKVTDASGKGGMGASGDDDFGYRLRLSGPRPDFEVFVTPSGAGLMAGRASPLTAHVRRKDGFDGDVELSLVGAPAGFALQGATIPRGRDRIRFTISAPTETPGHPISLSIEGRARIGDRTVARQVAPADDMMQAFANHHLVPSEELLVSVLGPKNTLVGPVRTDTEAVRIPAGGTAEVRVSTTTRAWLKNVELALNDAPEGIALESVKDTPSGVALVIRADEKHAKAGLKDNLIVSAYRTVNRAGTPAQVQRQARVPVGYLPAIPFEVVTP